MKPPQTPVADQSEDLAVLAERFARELRQVAASLQGRADENANELCAPLAAQAEARLRELQTAVTQALGGKDMGRVRVLTTAKNHLYEALHQLRNLAAPPVAPRAGEGGSASPASKPAKPARPAPSALSRAAQEKDAAAAAERRPATPARPTRVAKPAAQPRPAAARKKPAARNLGFLWLPAVAIVVGVLGWFGWGYLQRPPPRAAGNHLPSISSVAVSLGADGRAVASPVASDEDGDHLAFDYTWRVNGEVVAGQSTSRLPSDLFKPGDRVTVEVTVTDGQDRSEPRRSAELRIGAAPAPQ